MSDSRDSNGPQQKPPPKPKLSPEERRAKAIANLRPFPKGVSGNPRGRKPGLSEKALRLLEDPENGGWKWAREVLAGQTRASDDTKFRIFQEMLNRVYGKPVDAQLQVRLDGNGDGAAPQLGNALESIARLLSGAQPLQIVDGTATELATIEASSDDNPAE